MWSAMLVPLAIGPEAPAPACGTRRAFVDLGANDGQSLRWFERHLASRNRYTNVVAFEMNPAFAPVLRDLLRRHPGGSLERAAAWTRDGEMRAFMQLPGSRTASKRGIFYNMTASALQDEATGVPMNRNQLERPDRFESSVRVPTVDFAKWLSERFCESDFVFVKMDIEGAEFELVEHLLTSGAVALIDKISVEWHTVNVGAKLKRARRQQKSRLVQRLTSAGAKAVEWAV